MGINRETLNQRCEEFSSVQRLVPMADYFVTGILPEQSSSRDSRAISTIVWASYYMARYVIV